MEEKAGVCHQAKARLAGGTVDKIVAARRGDSRGGFGQQIGKKQGGPAPHEPLRSLSLPLPPSREDLRSLFQARAKLPPVCRAVAGLEGTSQHALQRSCTVRKAFTSGFAAVRRKAPCSQIKLQMVSRSPDPAVPALLPDESST